MIPKNYRTHHDFNLFGKNLTIGAMARPDYPNPPPPQDPQTTVNALQQIDPKTVLIGLYEWENFKPYADKIGLEYHHIPIKDYVVNSPDKYDAIYMAVKKATDEGKNVTIHCGAGDGRTGTALASLKLRDLIQHAAKDNPSILDEKPGKTELVSVGRGEPCLCTPLVKAAIEHIRLHRTATDDSGKDSVEGASDIEALLLYEQHLRVTIKHELNPQQSLPNVVVPPPIESPVASSQPIASPTTVKKSDPFQDLFDMAKKSPKSNTSSTPTTPAVKKADPFQDLFDMAKMKKDLVSLKNTPTSVPQTKEEVSPEKPGPMNQH